MPFGPMVYLQFSACSSLGPKASFDSLTCGGDDGGGDGDADGGGNGEGGGDGGGLAQHGATE